MKRLEVFLLWITFSQILEIVKQNLIDAVKNWNRFCDFRHNAGLSYKFWQTGLRTSLRPIIKCHHFAVKYTRTNDYLHMYSVDWTLI